jgi:hypothetical protein
MFEPGQRVQLATVSDGSSNTMLVVEAADPVAWPEPNDFDYDARGMFGGRASPPVPPIGRANGRTALVLMADGSVRVMTKAAVSPDVLRALVSRDGGEVIDMAAPFE